MLSCCRRIVSELRHPMFGLEEMPKGKLDLKETFQIDKGLCSYVGIFKLFSLVITLAILVHALATHPAPLFYPAFLTAWGIFFAICYQIGSLLLTISTSCCSTSFDADIAANKNSVSRLVKFTWITFSVSSVMGCVITVLYWPIRPAMNLGPIILVDVTTHGGVLIILLLQGLLVDRIPIRLKHSSATGIFALLYNVWLVVQNVVIQYNPLDDDDDDAVYDTILWKKDINMTLFNTLTIVFVIVPFFTILLWGISLPGRRYLEATMDKESDEESGTQELDELDEGSGGELDDHDVDEVIHTV